MASMMSGQAMGQNNIRDLVEMMRAADAGIPIKLLRGQLPAPQVENAPPFPQVPRQVVPADKPPPQEQMKSVLKRNAPPNRK